MNHVGDIIQRGARTILGREEGWNCLLVLDKSESTLLVLLFQFIYILVKRRKERATLDIKTYKNDIISGAHDNCLYTKWFIEEFTYRSI